MVTQKLKQGENEIIIESAESLEDARKNNFAADQFSRYFINGKRVQNYMQVVNFIIEETSKNKQNFIINNQDIIKHRDNVLKKHKEQMKEMVQDLKKKLITQNYPIESINQFEQIIEDFDKINKKIDINGVRVVK